VVVVEETQPVLEVRLGVVEMPEPTTLTELLAIVVA
jgi:hypothetical protein